MGAVSVTFSDPGDEPILEPATGETPLWSRVVISALLPADTPWSRPGELLAALFAPSPAPPISLCELVQRDWLREWRDTLQPIRVNQRLWVCPPGTPCPDPGAVAVTLEPGLAFGTGTHATTAMCLKWLAELDLAGRTVLDWGCGSGILAIAALLLGAHAAVALDTDPQALRATEENAARNGCADRLLVLDPAALDPQSRFDVVVANILADALVQLAPDLRRHCRAGARVALSGILATQAQRVRRCCASELDLQLHCERDGWVLLAGTPVLSRP